MASSQEAGLVTLYLVTKSGNRYKLLQNRVEALGPSGSPNHVVGSTPEKWLYIPPQGKVIPPDSKIYLLFKSDEDDTCDVSDCVISIPFTHVQTGNVTIITDADFKKVDGITALADMSLPAGQEITWGVADAPAHHVFGGGKIFISIEDDTA